MQTLGQPRTDQSAAGRHGNADVSQIARMGQIDVNREGSTMTVTSVSKLKASLSELLRRVKAGEEVFVTDRV